MPRQLIIPVGGRAVAEFPSPEGIWTLYELPTRGEDCPGYSPLWQSFKLMLPPETPKRWHVRRSYRLDWNAQALRFARTTDSHALTLQPDLGARVELFMSLSYDRTWLVSKQGLTVAEIEAEAARQADLARQRRARARGARRALAGRA